MQPYQGDVYLCFLDGKLFVIEYEIGSYGHSTPAPEELVTNKTGNKKLARIFKSIERELGQGKIINSDNIYMEWENDTIIVKLTEDCVLYSIYKPLFNRYLSLYEAKEQEIEKERQLAEQRRREEERLSAEKEKKLAEQRGREEEQLRMERKRKFANGEINIPNCSYIPAGIKSYFDKSMKIMGCYRHWSRQVFITWIDIDSDNQCDQVIMWGQMQGIGIYTPIDTDEDWLFYAENYEESTELLFSLYQFAE